MDPISNRKSDKPHTINMFTYLLLIVTVYPFLTQSMPVIHPVSHSRVSRAVFDMIPSHTAYKHHHSKVFISGSPCPCPKPGHTECVLDHQLQCRNTLNILSSKEVLFSGKYRRHRRSRLKKMFKKWIEEGGKHS